MGLITRAALVADAGALDAVKTYLRIDGDDEDSGLSALIATAIAQCEAHIGQMAMIRTATETIAPDAAWQLLTPEPVTAISGVQGVNADGSLTALSGSAYETDIDMNGRGRIRFLAPVTQKRAVVTLQAGLAAGWTALPEGVRQGIIRLVAHYHAHRERADELGPPAAVAALWRPARRVRL